MKTNKELKLWLNHNPQSENKKAKIYSDAILHELLKDACPESTCFDIKRTKNGKPYSDAPIHFSYSHSRRVYLYGISDVGVIGVDIEHSGKKRHFMALAERYFHPDETALMREMDKPQQNEFFYRLWSRKEAWCKLSGGVLWYYLERSVLADQVHIHNHKSVHFIDLTEIKGFAAAVATFFPIDKYHVNVLK
ncbi:4'-phosphopantetheinyl transferase family protein [Marinicella gelatinilytica]|uniref:4'-phosphopantetheinyl transferase family protein n=1 Tax=Marinicella gelatinilytica TaxID=2996017 RepID=UPI002260B253|nr:4'-phosphopantetheinyl transferase superfamily protein [Marinicella gelatinilytica]MCX7545636.1 4'-phosphopantetheinyl transferase superfamily protein [Marinicella gelatinilytica]